MNDDPRRITERQWQGTVLEAARLFGWRAYHTFDSRRSESGFPDLVLVHPRRGILFRELKTDKGRTSKSQERWIAELNGAGGNASVWRPADWPTVEAELRGGYTAPNPRPLELLPGTDPLVGLSTEARDFLEAP